MTESATEDKKGEALKAQRFQMLADIAKELSEDIVFPTCFDVSLHLRNVLKDPEAPLDKIVAAIRVEPLIVSRLLRQANSAAVGARMPVADVGSAITRLGLKTVRAVALAVAMNQLVRSKDLMAFGKMSAGLWKHSLHTAAAAAVIVRNMCPRLNADEAMLAGLVHDLGAFYMLYRASQYEELKARPDSVRYLISQWHESIGESVLFALKMPDSLIAAVSNHDQPRPPMLDAPRTMSDVIYAANALATTDFEWLDDPVPERVLGDPYHALAPEIEAYMAELTADFG